MKTVLAICLAALVCVHSAAAQQVVGWRGDGTGRYPAATPPVEWAKDKNIVWASKMPSWSNATPIIVGNRIYLCSEPSDIVCVSAADGKILWQKSNEYFDALPPEELPKAQEVKKQADALAAKIRPLQDEFNKLNHQINKRNELTKKIAELPKQIEALPEQLKAREGELAKQNDELAKAPDNADLKKKVDELQKQVNELLGKQEGAPKQLEKAIEELKALPEEAELKTKTEDTRKQIDALRNERQPLSIYDLPPKEGTTGYATATPVSDGKLVYVLSGNGVAACYDLDGNRKWIRMLAKPTNGWGHSSSPLLIGDKLIVHIHSVMALNAQTGETLWTANGTGSRFGTPVHAKVGDVDVVATPEGDVVRVSDGKILARLQTKLEFNAPIVADGTIYFIQHGGKGFKMPDEPADELKLEPLWTTKPKGDRYYASPLYHDGIIYGITQGTVLSAIDAKTGEVIYERNLDVKSTAYSSLTLAGGYIYASGENGATVVLEPGREYKQVKHNQLEGFRSSPIFAGKRMYVRALNHLYCISE